MDGRLIIELLLDAFEFYVDDIRVCNNTTICRVSCRGWNIEIYYLFRKMYFSSKTLCATYVLMDTICSFEVFLV
jgi:hypothetical protein